LVDEGLCCGGGSWREARDIGFAEEGSPLSARGACEEWLARGSNQPRSRRRGRRAGATWSGPPSSFSPPPATMRAATTTTVTPNCYSTSPPPAGRR
ncbi:unnamed protein product, partial [Scytosiphon promiscuus]